jgi:hypothetical protein
MTNTTASANTPGIGFGGLLTVLFIALKLTHVITWSWWWVLAPIWISIAIAAVVVVVALIVISASA